MQFNHLLTVKNHISDNDIDYERATELVNQNPEFWVGVDPEFIQYIDNPPEAILWQLLETNPTSLGWVRNLTDGIKLQLLDRGIYHASIIYTLDMKIEAVRKNPDNLHWFADHIPNEIKKEAIIKKPELIGNLWIINIDLEIWYYETFPERRNYAYISHSLQIHIAKTNPTELVRFAARILEIDALVIAAETHPDILKSLKLLPGPTQIELIKYNPDFYNYIRDPTEDATLLFESLKK